MHSSITPVSHGNEVSEKISEVAKKFAWWLTESLDILKQQILTAESLHEGLTNLNIERCMRDLELQQQFLSKTHAWHEICWDYWAKLGYDKAKDEAGLAAWLEDHRTRWELHPETRLFLHAWAKFHACLVRIQELNSLNQLVVGHVSEDTRRKLQALMEYAGVGNTIYTADGDTQGSNNPTASGNLTGGGRLLGKG